jgi:glycine/D-amino acid oxidase-like deaminating enzyme
MTIKADVVIVGAGIVGAACALELARENISTAIVDANGVATGATAAGMGHIVVMDDSDAQFALTRFSQTLWNALAEELPPAVEYEPCGTLWVAADAEEMTEVRRKREYFGKRGVQAAILDAAGLQEAEPSLQRELAGALLVPGDAVLYPPAAAAFFLSKALGQGSTLHLGKQVVSIGAGTARLTDGTIFSGKVIINAAGQYASKLTPRINIRPRKGHLVITDRYPGTIRHQLVELGYLKSAHSTTDDSVAFNLQPRKNGQLLVGSSRQYESQDDAVEAQILSKMLRRAFAYIPGLSALSAIRVWTGFRAATPDKLPLIGPWPEDPSIVLATGHEGLGITTSLATGSLAADFILGRKSQISMEPYLPARQTQEVTPCLTP